jgi:hypothetical protein
MFLWGCKQAFEKALTKNENISTLRLCFTGMITTINHISQLTKPFYTLPSLSYLSPSALERLDTEGKLVDWLSAGTLPIDEEEMIQLRTFLEKCIDSDR